MNVLVVTQYFWPESFRVNDLVEGLSERGHLVTVLTGKPNYPDGSFFEGYGFFSPLRELYAGAEVLRVPLVPRGDGSDRRLTINYLSFVLFASILGPVLCRGRYDVVFVFEPSPITVGLPAMLMKRIKGAPMIFWVQDLWPESLHATGAVKSRRVLDWVARLVRLIYDSCDRILVASRGYAPRVKALGVEARKVEYWPQWAEALYQPIEVEEGAPEGNELPEGFNVMFAGNIGSAQGFETLVSAAERLKGHPSIRWVIIGDGRMRRWVEEQVERSEIRESLFLLGRKAMEAMPRYFALADALLVTLRDDPLFSLTVPAKVQSYLASGRPIVASLNGEGAEVVEEAKAGFVVPAEDAGALAEAVLRMYETPPEERAEMGRRGRAYFEEHFEREKLLDRLEDIMKELVGGYAR